MILKMDVSMWHVVTEPGDATRYDFYMMREHDDFKFMPCASTFVFPQVINRYDTDIGELAKRFNCNPCTVRECMRIIMEVL